MANKNEIEMGSCLVKGIDLNYRTNCKHYFSSVDIIAMQFKCCRYYFACYLCHGQIAAHPIEKWQLKDYQAKAILCGNCKRQLTIEQYLKCASCCPYCDAKFNPKCQEHWDIYFELSFKK